jgi:phosphate:Na+ symporter
LPDLLVNIFDQSRKILYEEFMTSLIKTKRIPALVIFVFLPTLLWAAMAAKSGNDLNLFTTVMGILGGLAIFLYGMEMMSDGLKKAAGEKLKIILAALSKNRFLGLITGTVVTAIIQSSSVTTVLLVGFVSAGLMTLSQSVGIILGANIGTTITAQIVAFKVTKYALLMIAIGFSLLFFFKMEKAKQYGNILMGLGFIFYGMHVMSVTMSPLRTNADFINLMASMSNPILAILVAAAFTALIQSSSAAIGVVIVLAMQGIITLEAGIALSLGAGIGTCITAILASFGKSREAVQVGLTHVTFNVVGVALMLPFIAPFSELTRMLSPVAAAGLSAQEALAAEVPRQIANGFTIYKVAMAVVFLPFTNVLVTILNKLIPVREVDESLIEVRYMDPSLLETPELALQAVAHENMRITERINSMLNQALPILSKGSETDIVKLEELKAEITQIHDFVLIYLRQVSKSEMSDSQGNWLMNSISVVNHLENIGDILEVDLPALCRLRIKQELTIPEEMYTDLADIMEKTAEAFDKTMHAFENLDVNTAQKIIRMKSEFNEITEEKKNNQAKLILSEEHDMDIYRLEIAMIDLLKGIFYHTKRIAKRVEAPQREAYAV